MVDIIAAYSLYLLINRLRMVLNFYFLIMKHDNKY
jgi:hypothetical protein